eukprot:1661750-Amphidinium_carterae.1
MEANFSFDIPISPLIVAADAIGSCWEKGGRPIEFENGEPDETGGLSRFHGRISLPRSTSATAMAEVPTSAQSFL